MRRVSIHCLMAGLLLACSLPGLAQVTPGHSGSWFNPAQSGHGFSIEIISQDRAIVYWFTYDTEGAPIFLFGDGVIDSDTINANVLVFSGMRFGLFDPTANLGVSWGSLSIAFSDCQNANLQYQSGFAFPGGSVFGSGEIPLVRLAGIESLPCGIRAQASGTFDGLINANVDGLTFSEALLTQAGVLWASTSEGSTITGPYATSGETLTAQVQIYAPPTVTLPNGASNASAQVLARFRDSDFIDGSFTGGGDNGDIEYTHTAFGTRSITTQALAGRWLDSIPWREGFQTVEWNISPGGNLTGSDEAGCGYNGQLSVANTTVNEIQINVSIFNCGEANGDYTGVGFRADLFDPGDEELLHIIMHNGTNGQSFEFLDF